MMKSAKCRKTMVSDNFPGVKHFIKGKTYRYREPNENEIDDWYGLASAVFVDELEFEHILTYDELLTYF